jgi:hypothetical protein
MRLCHGVVVLPDVPALIGTLLAEVSTLVRVLQDGGTRSGMCAIAFRRDGRALAAYSNLSGFVYVWTLQPAWAIRLSVTAPQKHALAGLLGAPPPPRVAYLAPFRVVSAPAGMSDAAPLQRRKSIGGSSAVVADLAHSLEWEGDGSAIVLKYEGRSLGSIAVQCP